MLFDPRYKKRFQTTWAILCALIIVSMIMLYAAPLFVTN